jgi:curved DNA-binding protein CbpA
LSRDPYEVLGVKPGVSTEDLHDAYRRLVKIHHPDRNGGSAEATRRFQEIQAAYEEVRSGKVRPRPAPPRRDDASVASRMADIERELRDARDAAREAIRDARGGRPTDEDLGYYTTDDTFSKILADVRTEVSDKLSDARKHPAVKRVADLVDGLEDLSSRFGKR